MADILLGFKKHSANGVQRSPFFVRDDPWKWKQLQSPVISTFG